MTGREKILQSNVKWTIFDYDLAGYNVLFAELVLIDGADHVSHDYHAHIAWKFFYYFKSERKRIIVQE